MTQRPSFRLRQLPTRGAVPLAVVMAWVVPLHAWADDSRLQAEGGLEFDSNVTLATADAEPAAALVLRGAALSSSRFLHGRHSFGVDAAARLRAALDPTLASEMVGLGSVDLRWLYEPKDRAIGVGARSSLTDARGLAGVLGARTFRNANAEGLVTVRAGDHRFVMAIGGRDFVYRPNTAQSYRGYAATAALLSPLWRSADETRTLALATTLGYEGRGYASLALASQCPSAMLAATCVYPTSVARHDQVMRAGVELTYSGATIISAGYRVLDIASNSFGQSLRRHQWTVAATRGLSTRLFGTLGATAQIDEFSTGAQLVENPQNPDIATLADEARSMVQVRLGYRLSARLTLEVRAASWTNLLSDVAYQRQALGISIVRD